MILVPNEMTEKIQGILNDESLSLKEKAQKIYGYDKMICDMAPRNQREEPKYTATQIHGILEGRK